MVQELPVRQRTVSAAATGVTKPAGAAASVFDAARQAKPVRKQLPVLDASSVPIRSNVPLPPPTTGPRAGSSNYGALLARMRPGQSAELLTGHARSLVSYAKKHGIKVAMRRIDDKRSGIWYLEQDKK